MSLHGKKWRIDGVIAGLIIRNAFVNGRYTVIFERNFARLEEIESINWGAPVIERVGANDSDVCLPVGYGFKLADIQYNNNDRTYRVELNVGTQYLGDVTGYQEQVAQLQAAAAEQSALIAEQAAQIEEQSATITEQTAEIDALKEAGTASELEENLDAAYQEGVDSVE